MCAFSFKEWETIIKIIKDFSTLFRAIYVCNHEYAKHNFEARFTVPRSLTILINLICG